MPTWTDKEFAATWQRGRGHVPTIAKMLDRSIRQIMKRRKSVEERLGIVLAASDDRTGRSKVSLPKIGARRLVKVVGTVVVFSDAHFWPEEDRSPAFLALIHLIRELNPSLIVNNGDAFDGARISRHPPTDWAKLPNVADELDATIGRLGEIEEVAAPGVPLIWNAGNHDSRFSIRLAQTAPEYVAVHGMDLKDHFPAWDFGWSLEINGNTMIKHRWHGGLHATWNNTLKSGMTMVTGHLHRLQVTHFADYHGSRWGVDCGTLSSFGPDVQKFVYSEDSPANWAQGLCVLTYDESGKLLPPELVHVLDGVAYFRGHVIETGLLKRIKNARRVACSPGVS